MTDPDTLRTLAAPEWQPIETAPHNEDTIIVFCPFEGVGCVAWYEPKNHGRGGWVPVAFGKFDFESDVEVCPTHWQPIPEYKDAE